MPKASVYSNQLIKFELLTQSIRQLMLPTAKRFSAFDPAVRMALADTNLSAVINILLRKTLSD